jgi:hypothetical protein
MAKAWTNIALVETDIAKQIAADEIVIKQLHN